LRLVTYQSERGPRLAAVVADGFVDLNDADASLPCSLKELLHRGSGILRTVGHAAEIGKAFDPLTVRLLPPVPDPQKVICVGLNYADHARESGAEPPTEPVLFNKFPSALVADGAPIVLPPISQEVDYEAELVVVIGRAGHCIRQVDAMHHVAGYTIGNDVSARDWQLRKPGRQWLLGKTFDTFAPVGPAMVTADEVDPGALQVQFRRNGETLQNSNTREFIFKLDKLIAYISRVCTLQPGDLIFTGTPPGVGFARKPPIFLQPGDVCEVEIEGLGVLTNPVVSQKP